MEEYAGQEIYDSWDPDHRQQIELDTYPVLTDDDPPVENYVYTADGRRIRRRIGRPRDDNQYCGAVLNLASLPEFFNNAVSVYEDLEEEVLHAPAANSPSRSLDLYPQAFLGNKGHYQSTHLPSVFREVISSINTHMVDPDNEQAALNGPVIGGSCQGYNSVLHRIRFRTNSHDVQLAEQTAFSASAFTTEATHGTKGSALRDKLRDKGLAFSRLEDRLTTPGINRALRLENTYHIDVRAIDLEERSAAYVISHSKSLSVN